MEKRIVEVPDGFKIDSAEVHEDKVVIVFSPKVVKDFEWYIATYLKKCFSPATINDYSIDKFAFEYRIGLFKFICDDQEVDWIEALRMCKKYTIEKLLNDGTPDVQKLFKIFPKEFIESLKK